VSNKINLLNFRSSESWVTLSDQISLCTARKRAQTCQNLCPAWKKTCFPQLRKLSIS